MLAPRVGVELHERALVARAIVSKDHCHAATFDVTDPQRALTAAAVREVSDRWRLREPELVAAARAEEWACVSSSGVESIDLHRRSARARIICSVSDS